MTSATEDRYNQEAQSFYDRASNIGPEEYSVEAPTTQVRNRNVTSNELAGNRLSGLMNPRSALSRRAIQSGKDFAASRGLMNSSISGGNAYGAWLDRMQPYALDEAATYRQAASENMAATNAGYLQDSSNALQAALASLNANAARDAQQRGFMHDAATDMRRAALNVENREDTQEFQGIEAAAQRGWQTGERIGAQEWQAAENAAQRDWQGLENAAQRSWQTGERIGGQNWQTGENAAQRGWQTGERLGEQAWRTGERTDTQQWQTSEREATQQYNTAEREAIEEFTRTERIDTQNWTDEQRLAVEDFQWRRDMLNAELTYAGIAQEDRSVWLQAWTMVETGRANNIAQAATAIYSNTNLTPEQQNAAIQNMLAFMEGVAPNMPPPPGGGTNPPPGDGSNQTPGDGSNQTPGDGANPPDGGQGGGHSDRDRTVPGQRDEDGISDSFYGRWFKEIIDERDNPGDTPPGDGPPLDNAPGEGPPPDDVPPPVGSGPGDGANSQPFSDAGQTVEELPAILGNYGGPEDWASNGNGTWTHLPTGQAYDESGHQVAAPAPEFNFDGLMWW